ncbi:hypothetical protein ACFQZO_10365 [Bradyrhizobium sp. GCM10027634]|uniref:hypothetical protein n=1 Tax=unclassified Bradyrhizobium TaxID=2631580 RepID=UPI00263A69C2|nr:hypothetical protein [Bradyrhizobium sp. WYCCWR 12677]MDN5001286.1 hypothetical protein [Bradyrhizobium sp. WYCCWR 12677]
MSNDIVAGKFGRPSVSNARHMREAASGLFTWAAEAGRDYVTASPCVNLPKLDPEHPRTRVLSEDEIKIFWRGLDRTDLPWDRRTRLALKFELVTMLRSRELLGAHRDELFDLDGEHPRFDVPLKRARSAGPSNSRCRRSRSRSSGKRWRPKISNSCSRARSIRASRSIARRWLTRCVAPSTRSARERQRRPAFVNCSA